MAKVKMFGTGNFLIGDTLYPFRDGKEVEAKNAEHAKLLKAEASRRKKVYDKTQAIDEKTRAKK